MFPPYKLSYSQCNDGAGRKVLSDKVINLPH